MLFGNPKQIFKMLRVAGIRIKFDIDQKALVIDTDSGKKSVPFEEIEKEVNGE